MHEHIIKKSKGKIEKIIIGKNGHGSWGEKKKEKHGKWVDVRKKK